MDFDLNTDMPYRYLGNTGLKVSVLSFGTMLMSYEQEDIDKWLECAKAAYEAGVNYFDSAEFYGLGQGDRNLGKAIREFGWDRKDLVIAIKIYRGGAGVNSYGMSRKHIIEGTLKSLKNMQLDYCDLVFSHRSSYEIDLEETCKAFDWLIRKGYAKYWCTSMWSNELITEAIKLCEANGYHPPVADQCEYSCLKRDHVEVNYRRLFERFRYGTTTWSPLCGGILTGKYNDGNIPAGDRYENPIIKQMMWDQYMGPNVIEKTLKSTNAMAKFAEELGCTQAQLALAWIIVNTDVSTCIMGATRPSQIESNVAALKVAAEWNEEKESKMAEILDNEPMPRMDWETFGLDKPRRPISVTYDFKLKTLHRRKKLLRY